MRLPATILFVASLVFAPLSQAALIWSASCQTVISVINEPVGSNGNVVIGLSPGISGCLAAGSITGGVWFVAGQDGLVADNLSSLLASSFTAMAIGKSVKITYDNSSSACYATAIALGGLDGECP